MAELRLHKRQVHTIFDLLGSKEDDITYSLGWAFSSSDAFVRAFLGDLLDEDPGEITTIDLQKHERNSGRTDIEIRTTKVHVVLEAKRGWWFPEIEQLEQYAKRFEDPGLKPILVVAAEASEDYAHAVGPFASMSVQGYPVKYIPWSRFVALANVVRAKSRNHAEKRLLQDVADYLRGLMSTQDIYSNMVYVVALGDEIFPDTKTSFVTIVTEHNTYFHPVGNRYPKSPPNYLGFRFDGKLQMIRHVDGYTISDDPWNQIPDLSGKLDWSPSPHYSYRLGDPIIPTHDVRSTRIRDRRVWAPLDLLLTSSTIPEAERLGKEREHRANSS